MARHKHVINVNDIEPKEVSVGDKFHHIARGLGSSTGNVELGCSHFRVAPGKYAFPKHSHVRNEEALYILEGRGTLTIADDEIEVSEGDYAALPVGRHLPHKLVNTGETDLVYLCLSTNHMPEITEYPDSGKVGVLGGADWNQMLADFYGGKDVSNEYFLRFYHRDTDVDYFTGEVDE